MLISLLSKYVHHPPVVMLATLTKYFQDVGKFIHLKPLGWHLHYCCYVLACMSSHSFSSHFYFSNTFQHLASHRCIDVLTLSIQPYFSWWDILTSLLTSFTLISFLYITFQHDVSGFSEENTSLPLLCPASISDMQKSIIHGAGKWCLFSSKAF